MAKDTRSFLKIERKETDYRDISERKNDYKDVAILRSQKFSLEQSARCMDCGTPFCHWACPVGNYIPEWNEYVAKGNWEKAFDLLNDTNNYPEITGRVCPALCEYACVLGIDDDAVTVRENELAVIEYAFENDLIVPHPPKKRSGEKVAVVGSGPAGLACAVQLNNAGHNVTVFEKDKYVGGLLRYGIPDFKLEKNIIERRLKIWKQEGIDFKTGINVGVDYNVKDLLKDFDAVCLAGGSRKPRDLGIDGRNLDGIHFAMDYLTLSNKNVSGEGIGSKHKINAKDKVVVVIGGGDTGSDCVGTANRQGAKKIIQIEVLSKPDETRPDSQPWPSFPMILKTTSSHKEGVERHWSILTKKFSGEDGKVKNLHCVKVEFEKGENGSQVMKEVPNVPLDISADLVLLAIGFVHPEHEGLLDDLKVKYDERGNVKTASDYMTSVNGVFAAGDMHIGQSLVVHAMSEGRQCAERINKYLDKKI